MNLSTHFTLSELLSSQTAARRGYAEQFNPPPAVIQNLTALCANILEPLRISLNVPLRISSGYRCARLNKAIGGAKNSQHVDGQAADIQSAQVSNLEIARRIIALGLPFSQIILEFPDEHGEPAWIHVSHSTHNRGQVLRAVRHRNGTRYEAVDKYSI